MAKFEQFSAFLIPSLEVFFFQFLKTHFGAEGTIMEFVEFSKIKGVVIWPKCFIT